MTKLNLKNYFHLLLSLFSLIFINNCSTEISSIKIQANDYEILHTTASANFAPDGRLWRIIPTAKHVLVDYSDDNGKSYSQTVKINPIPQKISAWPENPPAIAISQSGRIHVLYYADEQQKSTNYYSYSDDKGQTFKSPVLISDKAETAMHYMAKMLLDNQDKIYLFWHDMRHHAQNQHLGSSVLALYYSATEHPETGQFDNQFISNGVCSCCRTATALAPDGLPVVFARMVFKNGVRDHALFKMQRENQWSEPQPISDDNWQIEACPSHGPALAIDAHHRSHFVWFTLGQKRQGIFYAYSDDYGKNVSQITALGDKEQLPSHPDVLAFDETVILVWTQFDGEQNHIQFKSSADRGQTWSTNKTLISSSSKISRPKLLNKGSQVFLSLTNTQHGHQLIEIPYEN